MGLPEQMTDELVDSEPRSNQKQDGTECQGLDEALKKMGRMGQGLL